VCVCSPRITAGSRPSQQADRLRNHKFLAYLSRKFLRSRVDDQRESSVHLRTYVSLQTESDRGCARIDDSKATTE
ncbi:unnamed protein product, partial [Tenebrio molitor]